MVIMLAPFDWGSYKIGDVDLPIQHLVGALIFIIASATDWIDGHYARKYNLVTNLGKFLDPLADKLLVSAKTYYIGRDAYVPAWIVIVIISREFAVTGLRLVLAGTGEVVARNQLGKIKTWTQIIAIAKIFITRCTFKFNPYSSCGYLHMDCINLYCYFRMGLFLEK